MQGLRSRLSRSDDKHPRQTAKNLAKRPVTSTRRGAGEVLGKKQSGAKAIGCLRACSLPRDQRLLEAARAGACRLLDENGLDPADWEPSLLAALRDRALPSLDFGGQLPEHSLAAHDASLKALV